MQGREREIDTLSVRRPQPHTTNLWRKRRERENSWRQKRREQQLQATTFNWRMHLVKYSVWSLILLLVNTHVFLRLGLNNLVFVVEHSKKNYLKALYMPIKLSKRFLKMFLVRIHASKEYVFWGHFKTLIWNNYIKKRNQMSKIASTILLKIGPNTLVIKNWIKVENGELFGFKLPHFFMFSVGN